MKIKTTAREMKEADVRFISLVKRGANRLPFRIIKSEKDSGMLDLTTLRPIPKNEAQPSIAQKSSNLPSFAAILGGSVNRNTGDEPPAMPVAEVSAVQSIASPAKYTPPTVGKSLAQAFNTPKTPYNASPAAAGLGDPVSFKDLRAAIDTAMHKERDDDKARAFNEARSAFSRISPTRKSQVQEGGSGDAWSLRNFGGNLAASVLNGSAQKGDNKPVGSNALEVAFSRGL